MRVFLRAFEIEDFKLINQWRSDPEVTKLLGGNVFFVSSEREKKWIEEKIYGDATSLYLAICLVENKRMIGYLSITSIDFRNQKAEIGIIIGQKDLWNLGYAREALRLGLEYLFTQMNMQRVYAYVLREHETSLRLFDRAGFTREGILRRNIFKNNHFQDMVLLSILRDEFVPFLEQEGKTQL
jgi:RimJ/RimL family protein N-acetyltransferase